VFPSIEPRRAELAVLRRPQDQNDALPPGHPLWNTPNTLVKPRLGGLSDVYQQQFVPYLEANLACFVQDRFADMLNVVSH
jgi:phosphoglycerate dehydrogenase-like enzyme